MEHCPPPDMPQPLDCTPPDTSATDALFLSEAVSLGAILMASQQSNNALRYPPHQPSQLTSKAMHNETDEEVRATKAARDAYERGAIAPKPRPPILSYKILQNSAVEDLVALVKADIQHGWAPLGNVTMYMHEEKDAYNNAWHYPVFVQALVLRS